MTWILFIGRSPVCHLEFNSGDFCLFFVRFLPCHFYLSVHFFCSPSFYLLSFFPLPIVRSRTKATEFSFFFLSFTLSNVLFFIPFLSLFPFFYFLYFPLSLAILSILFPSLALSSDIGLGMLQY